jgi:hypothetical protein
MQHKNTLHEYALNQEFFENILEYEKNWSKEPEKIITLDDCPICNKPVKGNSLIGFLCFDCNLLFTEDNIKKLN